MAIAPLVRSLFVVPFSIALCHGQSAEPARAPAQAKAAQKAKAPATPKRPASYTVEPTVKNAAYGPHQKQVLDFWKAKADGPTPLLFYIHGGGWMGGSRFSVAQMLKPCLAAGISVVSVEYRFIPEATADGVVPPVKGPLSDAARALQFVRSKAAEWNLNKERIGASGGSAGACSSLWLAFHPDMADPQSAYPVARESTRLWCAGVSGAQTSLDPQQMKEWTPNSRYGGHAFGCKGASQQEMFADALARRTELLPWIAEYSPYALVSKDDPSIALYYSGPPALGKDEKDPTHSCNFGIKLQEHCKANAVSCELIYPKVPNVTHPRVEDFMIATLKR